MWACSAHVLIIRTISFISTISTISTILTCGRVRESECARARVCERKTYGRWEGVNGIFNDLLRKPGILKILKNSRRKSSFDHPHPSQTKTCILGGGGLCIFWVGSVCISPTNISFFTLYECMCLRTRVCVGRDRNSDALFVIVWPAG